LALRIINLFLPCFICNFCHVTGCLVDARYSAHTILCEWKECKPIFGSNQHARSKSLTTKMLTIKRTACLTNVDDQEDHAGLVGVGTDEREHHEHGPSRVDWISASRKSHMESMMHSKMKYGPSILCRSWFLRRPFAFGFEFFSLLWCDFENRFLYLYNL
jgi:hypothetical protein